VFSVEQRDALRDWALAWAQRDERVVAGAAVGSLALGGGDRHSDLDLTFAVADGVPVAAVLEDWTRALGEERGAVVLVDLERPPTTYRVFLLPGALQFDLSLTPADRFGPTGPRFRLLFGEMAGRLAAVSAGPECADLLGWGVIYGLHARTCIERGRVWQAEHYVGAVRDRGLALACLSRGLIAVQARGYDDLPADVLERFAAAHVASLAPEALRAALAGAMTALLAEADAAAVPGVAAVAQRLG
jgi:hypothetical protein